MTENGLLRAGTIGTVVTRCAASRPCSLCSLGGGPRGGDRLAGLCVLLPALVLFLGLTAFALWKRRSA